MTERTPEHEQELALEEQPDADVERPASDHQPDPTAAEVPEADALEQAATPPPDEAERADEN